MRWRLVACIHTRRSKGTGRFSTRIRTRFPRVADIVPIPGTRHPQRVEENVGALDVVLSENDLRRIDLAAPKGAAAGERYAAGGMKAVNI